MDTDEEDESSDEESDDALSSNLKLPWSLYPHKDNLWPSDAAKIFSVFIGQEKSNGVQIYGSIEVLSNGHGLCYIFKRDENDALRLQGVNTTPVLNGSRLFEYDNSLEMKFDIKDIDGHLAMKGFVDWAGATLDSSRWHEKQLCSCIHGQNGFAAVHYSIFSDVVSANIKVYLNFKTGRVDVHPKVCGSLATQYSCYDYSTRCNRDYYRIVLFKRSRDVSVEPNSDWTIPLSRYMVVVPSYRLNLLVIDTVAI